MGVIVLLGSDDRRRRYSSDSGVRSRGQRKERAMPTEAERMARLVWQYGEPIHALMFFAPELPHLQLWQALGAIREHRGDGHVACLVANQIDPCESLVLQAATGRSDKEALRTRRGWSEDEWHAAVLRLRNRGWLDEEERATPEGTNARDAVELATDRVAAPLVATLDT